MLEFPEGLVPQSMNVGLKSNTKVFDSTLNGSTLATKFAGSKVTLTMNFDAMDTGRDNHKDETGAMSAFLFELDGRANLVKIPMFHRQGKPEQGAPVVDGNDQTGGMLATSGWIPNRVVLKKGDFFTVNDELKMCLSDAVVDSVGNCTLQFAPWLRTSPDDGLAITTRNPYGVFRLNEDESNINFTPMNGSTSLSFTESYYV